MIPMNQECALVIKKASDVLGCIQKSIASRSNELILPLYYILVRAHLEYCAQFWAPPYKRDKWVQWRITKIIE